VQDDRIHIELLNGPMLFEINAMSTEYIAGLKLAIKCGWLKMHESGTYVKFTQAGAELFARAAPYCPCSGASILSINSLIPSSVGGSVTPDAEPVVFDFTVDLDALFTHGTPPQVTSGSRRPLSYDGAWAILFQ
jgi:hypothetical protein